MMFVKHAERIYLFRQCLISITGLLHGICAGSVFGYTSILFPQLHDNSTTNASKLVNIILSKDEESWIASVPTLAMFPATLLAGWALDYFGRKKMAVTTILFNLTGWLTMYFASSYEIMLTSRIISGIFAGIGYPIFLTYLGEVIDPIHRAFFLSFLPLGCTLGVFLCQLLGTYINWKILALMLSVIPIYNTLIMTLYISESYIWYKNRNEINKANECYTWFRGFSESAKDEFNKATNITEGELTEESFSKRIRTYTDKTFLLPLGITTLAFITNQLSGNMALVFYTSTILSIISEDINTQYYSTIVLNILRILATMASCILVKFISVRKVLTVGGLASSVSLLMLSIFLYLSNQYPNTNAFPIMCILFVISNVITFSVSLGPLPSVICGELYPAKTRGVGGAVSACCSFLSLFAIVKVLPLMLIKLTPAGTFLFFTICTFAGVILLMFVLPDTKNKTLKDIEGIYK